MSKKSGTRVRELRQAAQIFDFLRCVAQVLQILDGLRESRGQNEIAIMRNTPHE
jgi:hypothetical protein